MKNNDPLLNFLTLQGYRGEKLKQEYNKLKKNNVSLDQLIKKFVKQVDKNPNSLSCARCTDRTLEKK